MGKQGEVPLVLSSLQAGRGGGRLSCSARVRSRSFKLCWLKAPSCCSCCPTAVRRRQAIRLAPTAGQGREEGPGAALVDAPHSFIVSNSVRSSFSFNSVVSPGAVPRPKRHPRAAAAGGAAAGAAQGGRGGGQRGEGGAFLAGSMRWLAACDGWLHAMRCAARTKAPCCPHPVALHLRCASPTPALHLPLPPRRCTRLPPQRRRSSCRRRRMRRAARRAARLQPPWRRASSAKASPSHDVAAMSAAQ